MTRREIIEAAFSRWNTDKRMIGHGYAPIYAQIPEDIKSVLEVGTGAGNSLLAWCDIFPKAQVVGIDINTVQVRIEVLMNPRIHVIETDIGHLRLSDISDSIDLIIDDGSHSTHDQLLAIRLLRDRARYFIVEDVLPEQIAELQREFPSTVIESYGTREMFAPPYRDDHRVLFAMGRAS